MAVIDVYSRQGCHLCEVLVEDLMELVNRRASVRVHDIDSRPDWREKYDVRVPVVELDGEVLSEFKLDPDAVNRALARLADSA
jgi:predicted thioredoxin/glutaredoxin